MYIHTYILCICSLNFEHKQQGESYISGLMDVVLSNTFCNILLVDFWKVVVFVNMTIVLKPLGLHILTNIIPYSSVKRMLLFISNYCIQQDSCCFKKGKSRPEPA